MNRSVPDIKILVTGAAGSSATTARYFYCAGLRGRRLDNLNSYYDVSLKKARLALLQKQPSFRFEQIDLTDRDAMAKLFSASDSRAWFTLRRKQGFVTPSKRRTPTSTAT